MKHRYLFSAALVLLALGCNKKDEIIHTAGKGGKATVRVKPVNQIRVIDSCIVYVTYNSKTPSIADDSVVQRLNNNEALATFPQLRFGQYYFQVEAWDAVAMKKLQGGIAYEITPEDSSVNLDIVVQ